MTSNSTALGDHHREMINQNADHALSDVTKGDCAARSEIDAQRSEQLAEIDDWELRKAQRRAEVWHLNNVSEKDVADRIASIRNVQAHFDQFKLDQMTANEWISFERAVSCLTGQKDLDTADDARRTLLDAICAGKFHRDNPRALQCQDASSRDDWHWSVADFKALVEHRGGLGDVLKHAYLERESLLRWMRGCGFEPTADIQAPRETKAPDELESAVVPPRMISIPEETDGPPKHQATLKALLKEYPTRELEWPRSWDRLEKKLKLRLAEMAQRKEIAQSIATTSVRTIKRVLGLSLDD
jgi:hypothetical protein